MDESTLVAIGKLLAVLGLVGANGFFVASEFALVGIRRSRVEELAAEGHKTARLLGRAIDNLDANLAATQLGVTISSLALGWIGEPALGRLVEVGMSRLHVEAGEAVVHTIAASLAFAVITIFHIVLGELAPKSLALQQPERTAMFVVRPLALFRGAFKPVIFVLNALGNAVLRLIGLESGQGEQQLHSTAELKLLVAASKDAGLVESTQQEVVERAFNMADARVHTIMTPRLEVEWIDADSPPETFLRAIRNCPHEQVVVAKGALDQFVGVLRKRDLLDAHLEGQVLDPLKSLLEPLIVPDQATVLQVFESFKRRPVQMALVIDEYGVVQGLVTQIDLLQAIVGDISGEEKSLVARREDGSFLADGTTPVDKAFRELGITDVDSESDYHTLAGFALWHFQHVPAAGEHFDFGDWRFEVVDMDRHRIDKLRLTLRPRVHAQQDTESV